jgi:hypothetical protein
MHLSSSLNRRDQVLIQYVALKMTCKQEISFDLLKTTSFLHSHNAQHKAATPISTRLPILEGKELSQDPKR